MPTRTFMAVLQQEGEVYVAECLEIGTAAQGRTIEDALSNLRRSTAAYLSNNPLPSLSPTLVTAFEVETDE